MSNPVASIWKTDLVTGTCGQTITAYGRLVEPLHRIRGREIPDVLHFHLNGCPEIDVGAILLLIYASHQAYLAGWHTKVTGKGSGLARLGRHLQSLCNPATRSSIPHEPGEFLLREVPVQSEMVETLEKWAEGLRKDANATEQEAALWQFQIAEVVTNSFQHGRLPGADMQAPLVAGQCDREEGTVRLAVLDFGMTIPTRIEASTRFSRDATEFPQGDEDSIYGKDDGDLIRFACQNGITSKSVSENQGRGLFSLVEEVKRNRGSVQIASRNGLVQFSEHAPEARQLSSKNTRIHEQLSGTLINVTLKLESRRDRNLQ